MNRNIRKITDGAMMAAIVGVMLLLNRQTAGLLEGSLLFLFPMPGVFYGVRYGWKDSWMLFISELFLCFILGSAQTFFVIGAEAFIGMVYGCGVHDNVETKRLIIRTVLLAVITDVLTMLVFASFFGYDLTSEITAYQDAITKAMEEAGMAEAVNADQLLSMLKNALIAGTVLTGIMEGLITHLLSVLLLKRMRFKTPKQTPLSQYYPPKWSGYVGIAGFVAYYYFGYHPLANEMMQSGVQASSMIAIFYMAFYGMIGVMIFMTRNNPKGKILAVLLAAMLLFFASPLLAILGYLYITTDLHTRLIGGTADASEN